ncbi:hypothetical protein PM082_020918 [Marasmius tenuissimus]|nr:hypothetical protein PM082_020918 [Marasmius tenuissimus]
MPDTVDYVVVGGGTAGNALAVRLAEKGHSVLILEAGKDVSAEPEVRMPGLFLPNHMNPERNWMFMSTPQTHLNGRQIFLPRGKSLGGTSNINFMQLNRPSAHELDDAFKAFGVDGWSWVDLLPYYRKFEKLNATSSVDTYIIPSDHAHGNSGAVEATLPVETTVTRELFFKAMNEVGLDTNHDATSGKNVGVWNSFQAIDSNGSRISSDTAYLKPNLSRLPNLHVATEAYATRVLFTKSTGETLPTAEGVEYIQNGEKRTIKANKEVILAAGSYHTPQLLELSGIGDPKVLAKYGINTVAESRYLLFGEPLKAAADYTLTQEHVLVPLVFELASGVDTFDRLLDPAVAVEEQRKYLEGGKGKLAVVPLSYAVVPGDKVFSVEEKATFGDAIKEISQTTDHPFVSKMANLHRKWLDDGAAFLEVLELSAFYPSSSAPAPGPGKTYVTFLCALQYTASRGTVHITSNNPEDKPEVDPEFLSKDSDLEALLAGVKFVRKIVGTKAFRDSVVGEVAPGKDGDDDEKLKEYIRTNLGVTYHPVGTAAMLPKELGGVVDRNLKVYGTENLRVVDASIFPIEFSVHPMATIYALAEKAADIIGGKQES